MNKLNKRVLSVTISLLSGAAPWVSVAQESPNNNRESFVLEEMIVTAQRRSQNIQDVANSIDALSGSDLDQLNKVGLEDYISTIGGVGFTRAGNGSAKIGMRGISAVAQDEYGFASTVSTMGLYLNDVAIQGPGALPDLNLYDLQRIEVLKGPQGTLYGEGAMGGAIKMILNPPDLSAFEGKAELTALHTENADLGYRARGAINIPLVEDKLAARIVVSTDQTKGWVDNIVTGEDGVNDADGWSARAVFLAQISDAFSAELLLMHDERTMDGLAQQVNGLGDLETNLLEDEYNDFELDLYAVTLKYDLGFAEFSSISSYFETERAYSQRVPFSIDEFLLPVFGFPLFPPIGFSNSETLSVNDETETFSQELRLVSNGDETIDWTVGAFYRDRDRDVCTPYDSPAAADFNGFLGLIGLGFLAFPATTFDCPLTPTSGLDTFNRIATETFEQIAIYGEAKWEFSDSMELTVGARYFDEEVEFTDTNLAFGLFSVLTTPEQSSSTSDSDVLFKAGVSWTPTDDQLYYFNIAEGFRSGGSNLNASNTTDPSRFRAFESDDLINFELGAKTSWHDNRLTLNGALFYSDWSDIQSNIRVPAVVTPTTNVLTAGGDAEVMGIELQLNYQPTRSLATGFTLTAQDTEFTDPKSDANIVRGSELPNAPELTAAVFAQYVHYMDNAELLARLEYRHVGEQRTLVEPVVPDALPYDDNLTILDSYDLLNLTLSLRSDNWYVTGFVNNATDERYAVDYGYGLSFLLVGSNPTMTAVGTPRTVGVTLGMNF